MTRTGTLAAAAVLLIASGAANASVLPPELSGLQVTVQFGSTMWDLNDDLGSVTNVTQDPNDPLRWTIEGARDGVMNSAVDVEYTLVIDTNPFISSSFNITNGSATDQDFVVTVVSPVSSPASAPSTIAGSVSGSVLDADGSGGGTISTVPGSGFYEAFADGSLAKVLYPDPPGSSFSAPLAGTANIPTISYGPEASTASAFATIGITNTFNLTAGDAGQMVSTFLIVPTPGSAALLGLAGLAALRRRRG